MSTESIAREAECGTVDVEVTAKTLGTTTAEDIVVPQGKPWLISITVNYASDFSAVGSSGGVVRLSGNGIDRQSDLPLGAAGAELNTSDASPAFATEIPTNMKCVPGNTINVRFMSVGEDTGTPECVAEFVFSSSPRPGWPQMEYICLEKQNTTVDTWTQLEGLGTGAVDTFLVPTDAKSIKQILVAAQGDGQALGAGFVVVRLVGNGVKVEQQFVCDGIAGQHTAESNGQSGVLVKERDIAIVGGNRIRGDSNMIGVDVGTTTVVMALGFGH